MTSDLMTDGPNTHHYRTFTRGKSFYPITIDYPDGDQHTFHVPAEVLNDIESQAPPRRGRRWSLGPLTISWREWG